MSWHLQVLVEEINDHGEVNLMHVLQLNRAARGFTHSANIAVGDYLNFEGIVLEVQTITHHHVAPHQTAGPNSIATCRRVALTPREIDKLRAHGFTDLSVGSSHVALAGT